MNYNPYLVIPLATWLIAQTIKFTVAALRGQINLKYFYASGGMPSVHSAVVCSLATTALLVDGASSHLFGFSVLFAAIVMYDSFGVRRSAGEQAAAINTIVASLERSKVRLPQPEIKLREILGHKPAEVSVGAVLGVVLACLFNLSHFSNQLQYLSNLPGRKELLAYLIAFGAILIIGLIVRVILARRFRGSAIMARLGRQIVLITQTVGWLGAVAAFGQYQHLPYLLWRFWSWLLLAVLVVWLVLVGIAFIPQIPEALAAEREERRKRKWLSKKPKKKRSK